VRPPARRAVRILTLLVVGSLALHAALVVGLSMTAASTMPMPGQKDAYLQKVIQKERARLVAAKVAQRITMPPPPPDPAGVALGALSDSLVSDVTKLTGNLLDVKLQAELAGYVKSNLKDELAAAAKDIADGRLTDEEIRRLHAKFQARAHDATKAWREDYLEKHQVERAAVSTTEWYDSDVSKTLFRNISFQLWAPPGYRDHPPSPELWGDIYGHAMAKGNSYPAFDHTAPGFDNRVSLLKLAAQGRRHMEEKVPDASWPGPGKEQAKWLVDRLRELHDGTDAQYKHNYSPRASWDVLYGTYVNEYYPHRLAEIEDKHTKPINAAWAATIQAAGNYQAKADQPAAAATAQAECLKAIGELARLAESVKAPKPANVYRQLNSHVRTEVLRGADCQAAYRKWGDTLLAGMEPLVRDFARGQFKKGILKHKDGVEQAMKEFPATVVPLLRRDVERLIPPKRFEGLVFVPYQHKSKVTGLPSPPDSADAQAEAEFAARTAADWPEAAAYMEARKAIITKQLNDSLAALAEELLTRLLTGNLLMHRMDIFVEGVDYTDRIQEKLTAREMAMKGRGQDLARLTADGVPDTSAPLVAILFGASRGHGASLQPVMTSLQPAMIAPAQAFGSAVIEGKASLPPLPAVWSTKAEQAAVKPTFNNTPRFEAIPFLTRFPRLDGDLADWGRIRPLVLRPPDGKGKGVLLYAAWNYQGFFFGVKVEQEPERFYWPSQWARGFNHNTGDVEYRPAPGWEWAVKGDFLRLMFDTLDARNANRGEPHTQEFILLPQGTESDPTIPGVERVIASQRDAKTKEYRGVKAACTVYPQQPPPASGPDGAAPYRVTRLAGDGYTMEVFLPRSLFKQPVFCPGWHIGFDCAVALGVQDQNQNLKGQVWATGKADAPDQWGDVLLLGTDPQIVVQEASSDGRVVSSLAPGQSYLVTVVDPDRNVSPAEEDTVLIGCEVSGPADDVEVFILKETDKNSGIFRGFINTQPGAGRQVQGVLEIAPMREVRLTYVDWANAKGQRNVIYELRLPVVAPVLNVVQAGPASR
jgi:hypothetical protein